MRRPALTPLSLCTAALLVSLAAQAAEPIYSDVVTVPRPKEGDSMGLYLMGKKVGYVYSNLTLSADKRTVEAVNEIVFKAQVGKDRISERYMKDTRVYESKPGGRLLSFTVEQKGDGGDQKLEATSTPQGLRILRKRPGQPNEVLTLQAAKEVVEDADQARVVVKRGQKIEGTVIDGTDLEHYKLLTTPGESSSRTIGGITAAVKSATTINKKENVPATAYIDEQGRTLEIDFGGTMKAVREPPDVAKRFDTVEVFGLTRVVLPKPPPDKVRDIPGKLTLVLSGVPEKFQKQSYRQKFTSLDKERIEVTISADRPKDSTKVRPLVDPNGGTNLKATLSVEANHPEVVALAKKIIGTEKNAYAAAKAISRWVSVNLEKDYGSSSDRTTDVMRLKKGDCTEHSLLAVSLMRAVGIPAHRVDGLVYLMNDDKVPALYWHEWVEAYVGEWTQLDPTFSQEIADATHFAVGEENNAEITQLIGQMKVLDVR